MVNRSLKYKSYAMLPLVKEAEEGYQNFVRYISGK